MDGLEACGWGHKTANGPCLTLAYMRMKHKTLHIHTCTTTPCSYE